LNQFNTDNETASPQYGYNKTIPRPQNKRQVIQLRKVSIREISTVGDKFGSPEYFKFLIPSLNNC